MNEATTLRLTVTLPEDVSARLDLLAREAGSTPEALLPYVLQEGFEATERVVKNINAGIAEADAGELHAHADVMAYLDEVIEAHAARKAA